MRISNTKLRLGMPTRSRSEQSGFTLIEVLISLLVLLIGLLGVAGIQIVSFQNNQGAYIRSQATFIASDFMDRIRANSADRFVSPAATLNTQYDDVDTRNVTVSGTFPCNTNPCSGSAMADQDIQELATHFTSTPPTVPNGYALVDVVTSTSGGNTLYEYVVTVFWSEKSWGGDGANVERSSAAVRSVELRSIIK
ncbi:MAG: type IV pilus assembly protein PilV [Halieaceae bacterium]|jgi:type IV pilus assembly protein PilV